MRRRVLALPTAIGIALTLTATPAAAVAPSYVALGDSFSSGVGTRNYYADGTSCYRSPQTYAALVATDYGLDLTLVACSGAKTADVVASQAGSLRTGTRYVSMTIGGNDVGFSSVLTECALPGWMSNCTGALNTGLTTLRTALPNRLDRVLSTVRTRSPNARVVVAGYPHLFNGEDCNAATFFSPTEEARLNAATDELNTVLRNRTAAAGMRFVSPVSRFDGHAVCDSTEWINGFSRPLVNSYHPNVSGYRAYAGLVGPALVGASTTRSASAAPRPVALPSGTRSAGSFTFTAPDLGSARAVRAAQQAGISTADLNRLRRAQRNGASNATLERLDRQLTTRAAERAHR